MVKKINDVSILANKIEISSKEQVEAIKQAHTGIHQIAVVTQNNTMSSENEAAAAQNLSAQSELLRQMVAEFNVR